MDIEHLKEYNGEKTKGDQEIFGNFVADGSEIRIKSIAEFEGYKCRIWPPEFHSILLDTAIKNSYESELIRKKLIFLKGNFDEVTELSDIDNNTENSFKAMQFAIISLVFSINSIESWVNKTIHQEIEKQLSFKRLDNTVVTWGAQRIEKDCSLSEKVFHVVPTLFGSSPIKDHVTCRQRFNDLISDRNSIIHIKNEPKIGDKKSKRKDLSLKLLRRNALLIPKNIISLLEVIYKNANKDIPAWLIGNIKTQVTAEKNIKNT